MTTVEHSHLTVLGPAPKKGRHSALQVRCSCGTVKVVRASDLRGAKSCGCMTKSLISKSRTKHGSISSPEYHSWQGMNQRCLNTKDKSYPRYGGRGITLFPDWTGPGGFERFLEHIGRKPSAGMSIDRIDNSRGYEPGNVRWATSKDQANNRRRAAPRSNARWLEFEGQLCTLGELARRFDIETSSLHARLRLGWDLERALTQPGAAPYRWSK